MSSKRPSNAPLSGPDKKRARMRDQRTISVQGGRQGGSAASGNNTLPPTIEVEKYAQARLFEINALQHAMRSAKAANTVRAFQSLPRALRRRAASHNIRRLPTRLREKALSEVPKDAAKPKRKTRKMLGRKHNLKLGKPARLKLRQSKKVWLETHIWHAKRMHMEEIWGHRLSIKPTEKAFRSSYRASYHGALLHDASYFQYLELLGEVENLKALLDRFCCDVTAPSPSSKRYDSGTRECETHIFNASDNDTSTAVPELLGPITVIWDTPPPSPDSPTPSRRRILLRLHPLVCSDALSAIKRYCEVKRNVEVRHCEKEFLTFEVTGRRATEVVKGVLRLTADVSAEKKKAWASLSSEAGPSSVPKGMVFGLKIYDPRLSFPPKLDHSSNAAQRATPSISLASSPEFWIRSTREALKSVKYRKRDIDDRRAKLLIPGSPLPPLAQDQRIPVLVSQRTVSPTLLSSSSAVSAPPDMCGWTLTVPAGWGMAFWSSLVFAQCRVGGLRERGQQSFEAGAPRFPEDYPGTKAFASYELRREAEDRSYWLRRPPAKRPNYEKLGTPFPFTASFSSLWEGMSPLKEDVRPVLVPPRVAHQLCADLRGAALKAPPATQDAVRDILDARGLKPEARAGKYDNALVRVKVVPVGRGAPEELAVLYGPTEAQRAHLVQATASGSAFDIAELLGAPLATSSIVGRVTSGHFSLKQGQGFAVGAIALWAFLRLVEQSSSSTERLGDQIIALVRNRASEKVRMVAIEVMQ